MAYLKGIDVSHWQSVTPNLTGLSFLFARAAYGLTPDDKYKMHIANARDAGLKVGAYLFGRYQSATMQAMEFLEVAGDVDFYVLDWEADGRNVSMTRTQAEITIATIQSQITKPVGLYRSDTVFTNVGQDYDWVANWAREPTRNWTFWQYRGSPLDLDYFNGTLSDLRKLAGESMGVNFRLIDHVNGICTVKDDDQQHYLIRQRDGFAGIKVAPLERREVYAGVELLTAIGSHPIGTEAWLVGERPTDIENIEAAFLLKKDVVFAPTDECAVYKDKLNQIKRIVG